MPKVPMIAVEDQAESPCRDVAWLSGGGIPGNGRPGSTLERVALYMVKVCGFGADPRTVREWASGIGVSYSSLRAHCALAGVRAHDAKNLARMLRAVFLASQTGHSVDAFLDVGDVRTLNRLLRQGGWSDRTCARPDLSLILFLERQRFIAGDHRTLTVLREQVGSLRVGCDAAPDSAGGSSNGDVRTGQNGRQGD